MRTLILPGLDGTGRLLGAFAGALPAELGADVVSYPVDRYLDYASLEALVHARVPSDRPYALIAESFSGPLAIALAAKVPPVALVLVGSFAASPVGPVMSAIGRALAGATLAVPTPMFGVRQLLVGPDAPEDVLRAVHEVMHLVPGPILAGRLRALLQTDMSEALASSRAPLMYLAGSRDRLVWPRVGRAIRALRPDVEHATIDAPHLMLARAPDRAAELIAGFILQNRP